MDNRLPLYQNIMLSGGTTMLPGLATRLERDIRDLYLKRILKVHKSRRNRCTGKGRHARLTPAASHRSPREDACQVSKKGSQDSDRQGSC